MAEQAPRTGLSLYANLLDSASSARGSNADLAGAHAKAKAIASKLSAPGSTADATSGAKADAGPRSLAAAPKTTVADWAATASDDEWNYGSENRRRGGRKSKKRKAKEAQLVAQDWDDIYDPTRPNSYEEYKHSDEKVREVREWRELLYRHRHRRTERRSSSNEGSDHSDGSARPQPINNVPDDATGEDAYTRHAELESAMATPPTGAEDAADEARSNLPGQAGFAERLMAKYGWSKGQGLGAKGTGITNALYAKADKRKKKSDAEGGGYATPASMGRIMGGQKSKEAAAEDEGPFGAMSEVVRLSGMLDGIDVDAEMGADGGGLVQEIGDECGAKYGSVQRVYIHRQHGDGAGAVVFVHFVSPLSGLRAVNALDGRMFGGNTISARFWSKDKFLADEYE
ncbi:hypothetical protein DV737_g5497, partial [Chaetothyriales sp. CBS 132003]